MLTRMKLSTLAAIVLFAVALSGCGGGGATKAQLSSPLSIRNLPGGIPAAARSRPLSGESVVQSSNSSSGVTTDNISVRVDFTSGGSVHYTVANDDEWFLASNDFRTDTIANRRNRLPAGGSPVTGVLATKGSSQRSGVAAEKIEDGLSLVMYTDIESAADTDYLVWGVWVDVPDNVIAHQEIVHGAFGFGSRSFSHQILEALGGTAQFRGDVAGMYFEPGDQPLGGFSFEARVILEASFSYEGALISVRGTIDNFRIQTSADGTRGPRPEMMVTLEGAAIDGADSGVFEGISTGIHHDGTPLSGRWGGRLHGTPASDGRPGSITGTFGSVGGNRGVIGAFGARRQ